MYKRDMACNNLQVLIYHETKPTIQPSNILAEKIEECRKYQLPETSF